MTPLAGIGKRFAALTMDCFILEAVRMILTAPFESLLALRPEALLEAASNGDMEAIRKAMFILAIYLTVVLVLWGVYFTVFVGISGQTPGKRLFRVRVVRSGGEPMDFKTAFNRFIGYNVSAGALGIGFLVACFNDRRETWHDKMAGTRVVQSDE